MANDVLAAWGVEFLSAVDGLVRSINKYNSGFKFAFSEPNKTDLGAIKKEVQNLIGLKIKLMGILSSLDINSGNTATILNAFDNIITKNNLDSPKLGGKGKIVIGTPNFGFKAWYDRYIKPLI